MLDICILKCLSLSPSYGYKLVSDISKYVEISESTLYPILKRLEEQELLSTYKEEHNSRLRKYYKITSQGEERLKELVSDLKKIEKIISFIKEWKEMINLMNKEKFLKTLEDELNKVSYNDIPNIIEYYNEYIEDQKELDLKEKDIIKNLDISDIIKNLKIEQKIDSAVTKPTLSNGIKALIAVLSVLSVPILIPVAAIIFAILITIFSLFFALLVTFGALIFAATILFFGAVVAIFTGKLPLVTSMFCIGFLMVLISIFLLLTKWLFDITKSITTSVIISLKNKFNKKREKKNHE